MIVLHAHWQPPNTSAETGGMLLWAETSENTAPTRPRGRAAAKPMAWMVSVNGFILDARSLPRRLQEEAYRKGLIPYIPGEKDAK